MSHHFDSPTAIADGRINLCDFYVFPAAPGTTALIVTVNPDAGRSSPTTFRPAALYEFVLALADLFGLRGQHSGQSPASASQVPVSEGIHLEADAEDVAVV
jgi:hypothetical protein